MRKRKNKCSLTLALSAAVFLSLLSVLRKAVPKEGVQHGGSAAGLTPSPFTVVLISLPLDYIWFSSSALESQRVFVLFEYIYIHLSLILGTFSSGQEKLEDHLLQ